MGFTIALIRWLVLPVVAPPWYVCRAAQLTIQCLSDFMTVGFRDLLLSVTVFSIPDSTVTVTVLIGFWDLSDLVTISSLSHDNHKIL